MTDQPAVTRIIKDRRQVRKAVTRMLADAYQRAKRATRAKWKQHARPMTWRELRDLARVDYQAYLQTDHWQRTRRAALRRAGYACQDCSATGEWDRPLETHHDNYKRLGRERPQDLRVLCDGCHEGVHRK